MLERAKTSLREGDSEAYHVLTEFAERLQKLSPDQKPKTRQPIEIFSVKGQHRAELVPNLVAEGRNKCVLFNGHLYSPSGIGTELNNGSAVNGWVWWQYQNDKGETRLIDDFRKLKKH